MVDYCPREFAKGDKVRDIYTGAIYTVKCTYWQQYDGAGDWTVEFEPTASQRTPWNKSRNLEIVATHNPPPEVR